MNHTEILQRDPTIRERFRDAVKNDPWRSSDFLREQLQKTCSETIEIEGREYTIKSIERIHPKTTETTDLVFRIDTCEKARLYAKADVSEDFVYWPTTKEMHHVYGARSQRESLMHEFQKELGLPYIAAKRVGQKENIWFISEEAPGRQVGDIKAREIIEQDVQRYCYAVGEMIAFSYLFGISDGHNQNSHYDGTKLTQRDLEQPFTHFIPLRVPFERQDRKNAGPSNLFIIEPYSLFALENGSLDSAWKKDVMITSLEDHLWPVIHHPTNNLRFMVGEGFTACFEKMKKRRKEITEEVYQTLNSWIIDPNFFLDMHEVGPFPMLLTHPTLYKLFLEEELKTDNPWRIINSIWNNISVGRIRLVLGHLIET